MKHPVQEIRGNRGGGIVIIGSMAGLEGGRETVHAAMKFPQAGLALPLDREFAPRGSV